MLVAPGMLTESFLHWYVNGAEPEAVTANDAGDPTHTVCGAGLLVTELFTTRLAAALATLPQRLVTTQSYNPASASTVDAKE